MTVRFPMHKFNEQLLKQNFLVVKNNRDLDENTFPLRITTEIWSVELVFFLINKHLLKFFLTRENYRT